MREPVIFHIDVNSAFLSWTALARLEQGDPVDLRTIPSIVGGDTSTRHGVVLAKSIPAKAFGITTGEPVVNALRKCPHLVMASPDHNMYRLKSQMLMEHLAGICPDIEQVSIDECYMDYTPIAANYVSPEEAAAFIRHSVFEKFKFTVNVGISDRKVLAKMALICINGTVEEDNSDTCILCILQYGIPTCGICCGQKQIVNAILNELLCCSDLLIVL